VRKRLDPRVTAALVALEVVAATLAWRDLARRSDAQVRGNKTAWRVFVTINPGNALIYWLVGRRSSSG
jgi:hypothetical protein